MEAIVSTWVSIEAGDPNGKQEMPAAIYVLDQALGADHPTTVAVRGEAGKVRFALSERDDG